jgi:hypothetical protein
MKSTKRIARNRLVQKRQQARRREEALKIKKDLKALGRWTATPVSELLGRADPATQLQAASQLQQTSGNRVAQRMLDRDRVSDREHSQPVIDRQISEEEQGFLGNLGGVMDVAKNALSLGEDSVIGDLPGLGIGMDALGEVLGRGSRGEGGAEAVGGGLTKGLTSYMLNESEDAFSGVEANKGVSGGLGLLGSGLKAIGGIRGEQPSSEFGFTDYGEYADILGKMVNPKELATQGVQEGMMNWYNLAQGGADYFATGQTDALEQMGEEQLKGSVGPITQGYSMLANLAGSAAIGDYSEMYRISDMADKGELGSLPKLGSWLGDEWYDIINRPGGFGASMGEIGDFMWEGTHGEGGIKGAATGVADWVSDLF